MKNEGDVIDLLWRIDSEGASVIDVYIKHIVDVSTFVDELDIIEYVLSQFPAELNLEDKRAEDEGGEYWESME